MPYVFGETQTGEKRSGLDFPALTSEVLTETFAQTYEENPVASINRARELARDYQTGTPLSADTARSQLKARGMDSDLTVSDAGITQDALNTLMFRKGVEKRRQEVFSQARGGIGENAAKLGIGLATSLIDPLNIASAFIPVIGEARYAKMLAGAGGIAGRTGVRAAVGTAEGVVGAAIVEPIIAGSRRYEQADYDMGDSLLNVAFGGLFGAGLHSTFGAISDGVRAYRGEAAEVPRSASAIERREPAVGDGLAAQSPPTIVRDPLPPPGTAAARAAEASPVVRQEALKQAVVQAVEGEPINVGRMVDDADPFAPKPILERIQSDQQLRGQLSEMSKEAGWSEVGGKMLRKSEDIDSPDYNVVTGRTKWIPRSEWWKDRPVNLNEAEVATAVEKALRGERLTPREKRTVEFMSTVADQRRRLTEFLPTDEELRAEGMNSLDDAHEAAMVARASEIDETIVERLAVMHDADDGMFMMKIKEFLDEHDSKNPATRQADQSAPRETDPSQEVTAAIEQADEILARETDTGTPTADGLKMATEEFDLAASDLQSFADRMGMEAEDAELTAVYDNAKMSERWAKAAELATVCLTRGG